ncbi:MAG TPA: OstA-like protein, partial [Williamwhitmania sp.]|nr:OstA-like protein [Williamwhitmania sp.]
MRFSILRLTAFLILSTLALPLFSQGDNVLSIEHADNALGMKGANGESLQKLIGHVRIRHMGTLMLCDSAYKYSTGTLIAYHNIKIIRDAVTLYGDRLTYDGNLKQGVVTGKEVRMVDDSSVLVTTAIKFDTQVNSAEYSTGGTITNPDGNLVSQYGYYYKDGKKAVFKGKVVIVSGDRVIKTDSIMYLTDSKTVVFIAPTVVTTPKDRLTFNRGRYNRVTGLMQAFGDANLIDEHHREVLADTINYYKEKEQAYLYGNVQVADSARKNFILGDYGYFNKTPQEILVSKKPVMVSISGENDTIFIKADTLKSLLTYGEKGDTIHNVIAFHHVRSFGKDFQSSCDSMFVSGKDSTVTMFHAPILWSDSTQITSTTIKFFSHNKKMVRAEFIDMPFIAQEVDSTRFNQLKGKNMTAYFTDNKITRLDAFGNGQTVYYMVDKDTVVAVNICESQNLSLYFANSRIRQITFRAKPESRILPIDKLEKSDAKLKGFAWKDSLRPKSRNDITLRHIRLVGEKMAAGPEVKPAAQPAVKPAAEVKKPET